MASSDPMGLVGGYGAASIAPTLEELFKQRILEQQLRDRMVQEVVQKQQQDALLAQRDRALAQQGQEFERTQGFNERKWSEEAPEREADVRYKGALTTETEGRTGDARVLRGVRDAALAGQPVGRMQRALLGLPEETPEEKQQRQLELENVRGGWDVKRTSAAMAGMRPRLIQTTDENGQAVWKWATPEMGDLPMAPPAEQRNREAGLSRAGAVIESIDELSKRINTQAGALATLSGAKERAAAEANLNDDVSEYTAVIEGFTPLMARAVGHTGVLTQMDVDSVKKMFPAVTDSKSVRDRKMKRIRTLWQRMNPNAPPPAEDQPADTAPAGAPGGEIQGQGWTLKPKG